MPDVNKKLAAKEFVARWQAAEGNEQRQANSFWIELCHDVLGIPDPTHVLEFERTISGRHEGGDARRKRCSKPAKPEATCRSAFARRANSR